MSIWEKIEKAEIFEKGQYFPAGGKYRVRVCKVLEKDTRKSGKAFIAECEVLESNHPDAPVGTKRSWFQSMKDIDVALPAIKEMIAAVSGIDPRDKQRVKNELDPKIVGIVEAAVSDDNILEGSTVWVETFSKKTGKGLDFTVHIWSPDKEAAA